MGICSSCDSTTHVATAKIILQDGRLQEFSYPVKASYVLQKYPSSFICNSDEMDFDDVVSAISDDEELQPGQLYFALPLSKLHYPLQAEEIAALAVKASAALMKSGYKCGCHKKSVCPVAFSGETCPGKVTSVRGVSGAGSKGGGRRNLTAMLSAIPE
ncbi:uncharacterized protein LOC123192503 [Mangifera indica]|uniref:uncharacterized protein LOC123192503 n=1 Tax=Mangifera indica TaxID=29780 RepID=UPI001CFB2D31|nr:uncharacterized protein LOC123192503 [Mangifera indica]